MDRDSFFGMFGDDDWWKKAGSWSPSNEEPVSEEEFLDQSNHNSFNLLTGRLSMDDIEAGFGMVHNPFKRDPKEIEAIMQYFIDTEEYEKCAELRDILNSGEFPRGDKRSHRVEDHLM